MSRMLSIAWKEMIQARRDRLTMGMMVGLPVIQLLLFGYAINTDVRNIATVVYDQDYSEESRGFVRRMEATGFYRVVGYVESYDQIGVALRSREAMVALVVPPRFGAEVESGRTAHLQLVVDGSDPAKSRPISWKWCCRAVRMSAAAPFTPTIPENSSTISTIGCVADAATNRSN